MAEQSNESLSANGWLDFAGLVALATAINYATGWIYADYYFANFQLGLLGLDIPAEYHLMYGFLVFLDWWFFVLPSTVLVLLIYYLWITPWGKRHLVPHKTQGKRLMPLFILLLCLIALGLGKATAKSKYREQLTQDFPSYPQTRVWLKSPSNEDSEYKTLAAQLPKGCYRLLLQNADKLYLFRSPAHNSPARLAVIEIALDEVAAMRILPSHENCDG